MTCYQSRIRITNQANGLAGTATRIPVEWNDAFFKRETGKAGMAGDDPIFEEEQRHLSWAYGKLAEIEHDVRAEIERTLADALADKEDLFDEMTRDFARDIQLETLAELEAMNRIIESYNLTADEDWTDYESVEVFSNGVIIDLKGHKMTVTGLSGAGHITDSVGGGELIFAITRIC